MNTNERYFSGPLLWIGISLSVIFAILFYTPFPLSIPLAIAAFVLNFHFRKKVIKRMNTMSGNSSSYSCINCGTRHNEIACPKCGSKMKRADFHKF
jgi:predicted RNA-binding Zn-ribbon protein involved in translation (DUF1610 family)